MSQAVTWPLQDDGRKFVRTSSDFDVSISLYSRYTLKLSMEKADTEDMRERLQLYRASSADVSKGFSYFVAKLTFLLSS